MTCHLAPEKPQPLSVTTEHYFQQLNYLQNLPIIDNDKIKSQFGEQYERELCFYLAKHAEMNCSDYFCLVGEESEWTSIIQEHIFLTKPVYFIDINLHQDVIKEQLSKKKFDRIILLNCLHRINGSFMSFINLLRKSMKSNGKLIIVHRESNINTLPLPSEVLRKWFNVSIHSAKLIDKFQRERKNNIEVLWKIERVKFIINKINWFSLLYHRTFYPLTLINQTQIIDGLRQLNETWFKYHQGLVEIDDQLLFLTIQNKIELLSHLPRSIQWSTNQINLINFSHQTERLEQKSSSNRMLNYQMSITDEIKELLNLNEQKKLLNKSIKQFP